MRHHYLNNRICLKTAGILLVLLLLFSGIPAYAASTEESAESGEITETADGTADSQNGVSDEILIRSDQDEEPEGDLVQSLEEEQITILSLNEMILELSSLDPSDVTREQISVLHDVYESLSMAGKAQVENYWLVEDYITSLRIEFPDQETSGEAEEETAKGKILDDHYGFSVLNDSMSVTVYYVTDKNGDGKADEPEIAIVSPSGTRTLLQHGTTTVENDDLSMTMTWRDNFMQMDIERAKNGTWRIETSEDAVINLFEYAGTKTGDFTPEQPSGGETKETEDPEKEKESSGRGLFTLLLFAAGAAAFLIGMKVFLSKRSAAEGSGKKPSKKKKKEDDDYWDSYGDDDEDDEKEQAEILAMQRFLKNQQVSAEYDDEAADERDETYRDEIRQQVMEEADDEEAALEEFTEYPSGMVDEDSEADDDDFGSRV